MKYLIMLLCLITLSATGCIRDGEGSCPDPGNMTLVFSLSDPDGNEVLKEQVQKIDLILFDNSDRYHSHHQVLTSQLNDEQEIRLALEPGNYKAVCWGNLNGGFSLCPLSDGIGLEQGTVFYASAEGGDPIYYVAGQTLGLTRTINLGQSIFTFSVSSDTETREVLPLSPAHKYLDIYVSGYSAEGSFPVIEVSGDHRGYDFFMNHLQDERIVISREAERVVTVRGEMIRAGFYISRVLSDNSVAIHIINPVTGAMEYTLSLSEALESFDGFDLDEEIIIPLLIEFTAGEVQVTLPEWHTLPAKPGLD